MTCSDAARGDEEGVCVCVWGGGGVFIDWLLTSRPSHHTKPPQRQRDAEEK